MKRIKRIEVRVTLSEYHIIKTKANKTGSTISDFVRNTSMDYKVSHKLTERELEVYENLIDYAVNFKNISNLFSKGDITGAKKEAISTAKIIREHLNKLQ